jgi:hypothetical protein
MYNTNQPLDKRRREAHPENIIVGDITYERNDVCARRFGITERSLNAGDKDGAPFQRFGNVKYRPQPAYNLFVASGICSKKPQQKRRRSR